MRTRIRQWGPGLAVRIPKRIAERMQFHEHSEVAISVVSGTLVVVPVARRARTLRELLTRVTKRNIQSEAQTELPAGKEAW